MTIHQIVIVRWVSKIAAWAHVIEVDEIGSGNLRLIVTPATTSTSISGETMMNPSGSTVLCLGAVLQVLVDGLP